MIRKASVKIIIGVFRVQSDSLSIVRYRTIVVVFESIRMAPDEIRYSIVRI